MADETAPAAAGSWLSILPALLAILFALALKRVIPALFLGLWLGAWIISDFRHHYSVLAGFRLRPR